MQTIKAGAWTVCFGTREELAQELASLVQRGLAPAGTKVRPSGGTKVVNGQPEDPNATWTFKVLTRTEG